VSPKWKTTDPNKLNAVQEILTLKNKHEIRNFLDLRTYYMCFIFGFANIENC
jgi:hypothetical protein